MNNKTIILPLGEILKAFKITRQSFYGLNKKYKVFTKERFGYYSTKVQAFSQIKEYYKAKQSKRNLWTHR